MTKSEALEHCILFNNVSSEVKDRVLTDDRTTWKNVEAGEFIFCESESNQPALCILYSGSMLVYREHNGARVLLNEIKAHGIVGASSLFGGDGSFHTTVQAKKKCSVMILQQVQIEELIKESGDFAVNYVAFLSDRIRFLNRRIVSFTSGSAAARLAAYLINRSVDGKCVISRTKLAAELDIGRASLYRAIDTLTQQKIIISDGKSIIIPDESKLKAFVREQI